MHSKCAFRGKQSIYMQSKGEIYVYVIFSLFINLPSNCGVLRLLLLFVICNDALINLRRVLITAAITITMFLFYHSKMAVILHRFVPILVHNKSMKIKSSIYSNVSLGFMENWKHNIPYCKHC